MLLKDIYPGPVSSTPLYMTAIRSDKILFRASDGGASGAHGTELFETDGTSAGTKLFKDLRNASNSPTRSSSPSDFAELHGEIYFRADDGKTGIELWKSDGTPSGTLQVADIWPGSSASYPSHLTRYKDALYFSALSNGRGIELWKTDGTAAGTTMVADINPGPNTSGPQGFCVYRSKLYFSAYRDGTSHVGRELFVTDGTTAGTRLVKDIAPGVASSSPLDLTIHDDKLYFSAFDPRPGQGRELWVSDGTTAGTKLAVDVYPGASSGVPQYIESFGGKLYFAAMTGNGLGIELYESDGTAAGTKLVKDIAPGLPSGFPRFITKTDGGLLMQAWVRTTGAELYRSDGTANGTKLVKDLVPGLSGSTPEGTRRSNDFLTLGKHVVFTAFEQATGKELYISDGSAAGTVRVADILPGRVGSAPNALAAANGAVFFSAPDPWRGRELFVWKTTRASAVAFGDSCGPNYPTLRSTAPVLGRTARLSGKSHVSGGVGVLFLGAPSARASVLGCSDYVGLPTALVLTNVLANSAKDYSAAIPIPGSTALAGIKANVQTWWLSLPTVLPIETTNAVLFTIGN